MVCPFRKNITTEKYKRDNKEIIDITQYFCDCYKKECPYYIFDDKKNRDICEKIEIEKGGEN